MKNYDFALTRIDDQTCVYTCSIQRRYLAALFDFVFVCLFLVGISILLPPIAINEDIAGLIGFFLALTVTTLPEYLTRQTLGMYLFDLVVIVPPKEDPLRTLLARNFAHLIELFLPSFIYFYCVAFSDDNKSIGDRISGCIVVRKKFLIAGSGPENKLSTFSKILIPTVFTLAPLLIIITLFAVSVFIFIGAFPHCGNQGN